MKDRRWIRLNLLTFRWCLVSSVGIGAFEVARLAHHSILDLIPPAMALFVQAVNETGGCKGRREDVGKSSVFGSIGNLSAGKWTGESESQNIDSDVLSCTTAIQSV